MDDPIQDALERTFGFRAMLPGQRAVIEHLLAGRNALAVFPTGGGKSLCYQLTALLLPGTTIVVSPLIALMKDQLDRLAERGIQAARLDSSLDLEEYRDVVARLRDGALRLLYVAPERFANERFRALLGEVDVALFAVDEAHCISEWGHNFRPDYLKLARSARDCGARVVLALTATATPRVVEDIRAFFAIPAEAAVRTPFHRPNLHLRVHGTTEGERDDRLVRLLREGESGATIVYVTQQRTAERVAEQLAGHGFAARAYHAGLETEVRTEVQDAFMRGACDVVVATIAFGMGIDKDDIRRVVHANLPKSLENYAQEIGRAGRDGRPSTCDLLVCPDDRTVLENFVYGDAPEPQAVRSLLEELHGAGDAFAVALYTLATRHDVRPLVLRTLLTYLELDGWLEERTPIYTSYQFAPKRPAAEIFAAFEGEPRTFLEALFENAKPARKWWHVDPQQAAEAMGAERARVVRALDHLAAGDWVELKPSNLVHRYRWARVPEALDPLVADLLERLARRETRDLERLQQVVDLAHVETCLAGHLARHFGEELDAPCRTCSACRGERPAIPPRNDPPIDAATWRDALALRAETPALERPVPFARFLAGITSPAATRARLSRHPLFGAFDRVRYPVLLERAREA